jgi:hypothetical protein
MMRYLLFALLLSATATVYSAERFALKFELTQEEKLIERGNAIVTRKAYTWSRGLERSYLRLRCDLQKSGKLVKLYSTRDHFSGLRVTHQIKGDVVELTVVRTLVQPRLTEIRALALNECEDLSPIVTTTTISYSFPAQDAITETRPFGDDMTFRSTLGSVEKKR